MKPTILMYTHTDVNDIWKLFFGQSEKWLKDYKKIICLNREISNNSIPSDYEKIYYNDSLIYRLRLLNCLKQIKDDFIIYHHEDMFLYEKPDLDRLEKYTDYLINNKNYHFVKLIRGGNQIGVGDLKYNELKKINNTFEYIFAIQPTIWKREKLIELIENSKGNTIWEFEVEAQKACRKNNIYGYYVDDGGVKRGRYHWDSKVYPYIATAIIKGGWNILEYEYELNKLFIEYNVDPKIRGINKN